MDAGAKKFSKLGDEEYKGNSLWPMYGRGGEIYFVADRLASEKAVRYGSPEVMKSVNNIWKISERGGRPSQVTRHTSGNLFFPSISSDGRVIVYEENFGLWKLDTATGKSSEVPVRIVSDDKENAAELRTIQSEAEGFGLSPSTKRAAIVAHGEIFTIATDRGEVQRVSETFWREGDPVWSPNGKWIAFTSDRTGREEIWIADERGRNAKKLTDSDSEKLSMVWAPDSQSLLHAASDHKLYRTPIDGGKSEELVSSDVSNISGPQFSPDGKWISYAKLDRFFRSRVYVKPLDGGPERLIGGDEFLISSGARWTPDGKKLVFLAGVGAPSIASTSGRTTLQVYSVALTRLEKNPAERGVDSEEEAQSAPPAERRGPAAAAPAKVEVKIDWDGLDRRIRQITRGSESVFTVVPSPDSRTYAFVALGGEEGRSSGGLFTVQEDGERVTRVAASAPSPSAEGPRGRGGPGGGISSPQW
ncbi:MAG: PD40 domain-containing protein, partial [Acidobacteria bacterium]|nr:PD40 domain-containing protein [Acidobacteriota bacterium]